MCQILFVYRGRSENTTKSPWRSALLSNPISVVILTRDTFGSTCPFLGNITTATQLRAVLGLSGYLILSPSLRPWHTPGLLFVCSQPHMLLTSSPSNDRP